MDELQISGKRFISSRRIAKDNGYHTDYIGQLIRGKKIKGQKVGRTWYVDAESFAAYLGQEVKHTVPASMPEPEPAPAVEEVVVQPAVVLEEVKLEEVKVEAPVQKKEEVVAEIKKEEEKIEIKKVAEPVVVHARYVPVASGGLRFVADDEPLLPEISMNKEITRTNHQEVDVEKETPVEVLTAPVARRSGAGRTVALLAATGVFIFIFSAVVSSAVFEKINIEAGNPASVGYGMQW